MNVVSVITEHRYILNLFIPSTEQNQSIYVALCYRQASHLPSGIKLALLSLSTEKVTQPPIKARSHNNFEQDKLLTFFLYIKWDISRQLSKWYFPHKCKNDNLIVLENTYLNKYIFIWYDYNTSVALPIWKYFDACTLSLNIRITRSTVVLHPLKFNTLYLYKLKLSRH